MGDQVFNVTVGDNCQIQAGHEISGLQHTNVDNWATQRRLEKRAAVAEQALLLAKRYLGTIQGPTFGPSYPSQKTKREQLTDEWAPVCRLDQEFVSVSELVSTHFGELEAQLMRDIQSYRHRVCRHQFAFLEGQASFEVAHGEQATNELTALAKWAEDVFKPHVAMTAP
jgi:hypothetical protein